MLIPRPHPPRTRALHGSPPWRADHSPDPSERVWGETKGLGVIQYTTDETSANRYDKCEQARKVGCRDGGGVVTGRRGSPTGASPHARPGVIRRDRSADLIRLIRANAESLSTQCANSRYLDCQILAKSVGGASLREFRQDGGVPPRVAAHRGARLPHSKLCDASRCTPLLPTYTRLHGRQDYGPVRGPVLLLCIGTRGL